VSNEHRTHYRDPEKHNKILMSKRHDDRIDVITQKS